jgi:hypothetical protein
MSKRFTASEKWEDPWFCNLSIKEQMFWIYILDKCNHAGIWKVNWKLVCFHIKGFRYNPEHYKDRIKEITPEKWFIPKFVNFQYGSLNPSNRAHSSVITLLEKEGASKELASPMLGAKDKDKDKDKVKDKDKGSTKSRYLEFVYLEPKEYEKLQHSLGGGLDGYIERLNGYIGQIGETTARVKYVSHYHTILNWARKDKLEGKTNGTGAVRCQSISEQAAERRRHEGFKKTRGFATSREILDGIRGLPKIPPETETSS